MKKIPLLLMLTATCGATCVAIAMNSQDSNFTTFAVECDHNGYHYAYIAATEENDGRKEYWKCCSCNEVFFEKPAVGTFSEGSDEYFGELDAKIEKHAHYDITGDFVCDEPGCKEETGVESIHIITPLTYMGRGEVLHLSSSIVTHGDTSKDVEFTLKEKSTDTVRYTLVDNKDGTADLSLTEHTSITTYTAYVTVTSVADPSVSDQITITCSTYNSDKIAKIKSFFGVTDKHIIPFVGSTTFGSIVGDELQVTTTTTYAKTVGAFVNQGTWTKVSETDTNTLFSLVDPNDDGFYFECLIEKTGTGATFTFERKEVELTSFPAKLFEDAISGKTTSTFIAPDDGTLFTFTNKSTLVVTSNGKLTDYVNKLANNGYYNAVYDTKTYCVSPERTLTVLLTSVSGGYTVQVSTQKAPTRKAWAASDSTKMINLIGEEIPFVANDYGTWYGEENYLYASSSRMEASAVAIATLDKATGYVKSVEADGVYYTKDIDDLSSYTIIVDGTELYIYLVPKTVTTWLGEKLAQALSVQESEIPAATGTSYLFSFGDGTASVEVADGDLDTYKSALTEKGYEIFDKRNSSGVLTGTYAISSDRTILVQLVEISGGFGLSFTKQTALTDVDWSSDDKQIMNEFVGQVLPFINDGYVGKWINYMDEQIYAQSYRTEAAYIANSVFAADASFVLDGSSTLANQVYLKQLSKYLIMSVTVNASGKITVRKDVAKVTTWESADIASALGTDCLETLPSALATDNSFKYVFGTNQVDIDVINATASTKSDYVSILSGAGFTTDDSLEGNTITFKSATDTLTVVVTEVTAKTFHIQATGHLPEGQSHVFPVDGVLTYLHNEIAASDLPVPEGSLFFLEENGKYDCNVTILSDGSIVNYQSELNNKEFTLNSDVYEKGNIRIALEDKGNGIYSIRFTLGEEPSGIEWSDEAKRVISEILKASYFTEHTELPCPQNATNIVVEDDGFGAYWMRIHIYGVTIDEFFQLCTEEGMYCEDWYGDYYIYDSATSYNCFQVIDNGTYLTIKAY